MEKDGLTDVVEVTSGIIPPVVTLRRSERIPKSGPFQKSPWVQVGRRGQQSKLVWSGPFTITNGAHLSILEHKIICYAFDDNLDSK